MKKRVGQTVIVIISVMVFILLYFKVNDLLVSKESINKYDEFYQETEDYDVLFLGSSHMMNTVYPMELWEQYGITSYNLANSAEALPGSYWVLKNALDYKKPKVVIVDCFLSGYFKIFPDRESFSHLFYDALPLSQNKIDAIEDLLPEQREEFLWDFSLYHSRWNELSERDFELRTVPYRGAEILTGYSNWAGVVYTDEAVDVNGLSVTYIRLMKELCDENDIQLVLCCIPYAAQESEQQAHNGFYKLADELGVEYLNLISADIVDYEIDMQDRGHLNASGARKVTEYMGEWILSNCNVVPKYELENWSEDYKEYLQDKCSRIEKQTNIYAELLLLHDEDFDVSIILKESELLLEDPILNKMINNITNLTLEYSEDGTADVEICVYLNGEMMDHKRFNATEGTSISYVKLEESDGQ